MCTRHGITTKTPSEVKVRSRVLFSKQFCIKTWIQSTQPFESLSVYEIQSEVDLTSNTDAHALLSRRCSSSPEKKTEWKKKRIIDTIVVKTLVAPWSLLHWLLFHPSLIRTTVPHQTIIHHLSSFHKGSFWNFMTTNQQVSIFKQKNRKKIKDKVNLLLFCQQSLKKNQLSLHQRWKNWFVHVSIAY